MIFGPISRLVPKLVSFNITMTINFGIIHQNRHSIVKSDLKCTSQIVLLFFHVSCPESNFLIACTPLNQKQSIVNWCRSLDSSFFFNFFLSIYRNWYISLKISLKKKLLQDGSRIYIPLVEVLIHFDNRLQEKLRNIDQNIFI